MWYLAILVIAIVATVLWGAIRLRQGRAAIRTAVERDGYSIVRMQRSLFRQGPLFWTTTPSQIIYRVLVRESGGRQRTVWARWGRTWLPKPDTVDLRWDDETADCH
jgi:hypothetical protein